MGGFVLGGGYGYQSRMYGLGIDNVLRIKVVLTNGDVKEVEEGDDLFWALRGAGGGNLGVVTEVEYRVYPSKDMKLAATVKLPFVQVPMFLQKLGEKEPDLAGEFIAMVHGYEHSPSDYTTTTITNTTTTMFQDKVENGTATVTLYWMGDSDPDQPIGMQYIKKNVIPLFHDDDDDNNKVDASYYYFSWSAISRQKVQTETWKTVWAAQSWNGFLFPENNTQEVWEDIRENLSVMFRYSTFLSPKIELWGGAISNVPGNATAFPYRQAVYNVGVQLLVPNGTDDDDHAQEQHQQVFEQQSALVGAIWPSIAKYLTGVYVNYPMPSLSRTEYPNAYWGDNLDRLVDLSQQHDPFQVFHFDQSIPKTNTTKHHF
jgi:FAD/FMN-containing dehydrogenase